MKYFVISDIHSHFDEMQKALSNAGFDSSNKEHIIISCGDVWDRGKQPVQVMNFLLNLYDQKRAILIKGNHEDLFRTFLYRGYFKQHDKDNGVVETVYQLAWYCTKQKRTKTEILVETDYLCDVIRTNPTIKRFLNSMIDYYEVDDFIFTHGFIPVNFKDNFEIPIFKKNWKSSGVNEWKEARWHNGMEMVLDYNIIVPNKTIVVGHFRSSYGHVKIMDDYKNFSKEEIREKEFSDISLFKPFHTKGLIAIDSCVAHTKKINCIVIENNQIVKEVY